MIRLRVEEWIDQLAEAQYETPTDTSVFAALFGEQVEE